MFTTACKGLVSLQKGSCDVRIEHASHGHCQLTNHDKSTSKTTAPKRVRLDGESASQCLGLRGTQFWPYTWWASKETQHSCCDSTPLSQESLTDPHLPSHVPRLQGPRQTLPRTCTKFATLLQGHQHSLHVDRQGSCGTGSPALRPSGLSAWCRCSWCRGRQTSRSRRRGPQVVDHQSVSSSFRSFVSR